MSELITVLGIPGSGKTTQIEMLKKIFPKDDLLVATINDLIHGETRLLSFVTDEELKTIKNINKSNNILEYTPKEVRDILLKTCLRGLEQVKFVVTDAIPRDINQAKYLLKAISPENLNRFHTFLLAFSNSETENSFTRQFERAIKSYSFRKAQEMTPIIHHNTNYYLENTKAALEYLENSGISINIINASTPPKLINKMILDKLSAVTGKFTIVKGFDRSIIPLANEFLKFNQIKKNEHNIAVIGSGGRDEHSNFGIVFFSKPDTSEKVLPTGTYNYKRYIFNVKHVSTDSLNPKDWSPDLRYKFVNETSIISDPEGKLATLQIQSMMTENEQKENIARAIINLGDLGINFKGMVNKTWRGIHWDKYIDHWMDLKDSNANLLMFYKGIEHIIDFIFALNREFSPSSDVRYNLVQNLDWTPENFKENLNYCLTVIPKTKLEFWNKASSIISLASECIYKAIDLNILPEDLKEYNNSVNNKLHL